MHSRIQHYRRRLPLLMTLAICVLASGLVPADKIGTAHAAQEGGYSAFFAIKGLVRSPAVYTLDQLRAMRPTSIAVHFEADESIDEATYTGVLLWDLIRAAGPQSADGGAAVNRLYVVATGSDGYQSVVALGEIMPSLRGDPVIVAYARDGTPLGQDRGMAQLIIPGDKGWGRNIYWLTSLDVRDAAE